MTVKINTRKSKERTTTKTELMRQAKYGMFVRMALIMKLLGVD